jgi:hypothetical protein
MFRGSAALAAGTLTPGELRGPSFQRLFRDVYVCADVPITHEVRAAAAARLLVPESTVTGWSALALWGLAPEPDLDVELTVPRGSTVCRLPGIGTRRRDLDPAHVTERRGVRTTTVESAVVDLARTGCLDDAVVLVDRVVDKRLTNLAVVREVAAQATGRGCCQAREAAALADGLAGSPQETRLRLLMHRSSLPRPVAQFVVRDTHGFIARVDFAWPAARVVVEYEGVWHGETPQQVAADRRRLNRLRAAGWTVVFVTAADLHHPERVVAEIAAALNR